MLRPGVVKAMSHAAIDAIIPLTIQYDADGEEVIMSMLDLALRGCIVAKERRKNLEPIRQILQTMLLLVAEDKPL